MRRQKSDEENAVNEFNKLIVEKDKIINKALFKKYLGFQSLIDMQKQLYKTENTETKLIQLIESDLSDLKEIIEEMSE